MAEEGGKPMVAGVIRWAGKPMVAGGSSQRWEGLEGHEESL